MAITSLSVGQHKNIMRADRSSGSNIDMRRVAVIILGGGQGTRLFPLTVNCCKPAACVGGKFRLIDIPISNAINSGCSKIFILTQFLSSTLHHHIYKTFQPGTFSSCSIELLPAEQKPSQQAWFQGTADAVRQNIDHLIDIPVDYFLILSGDQLYNMNFQHMVQYGKNTDADLIVASLPIQEEDAKRMGVLKINEDNFIVAFQEKPQTRELLASMQLPEFTLRQMGEHLDSKKQYLGSMGIYLFKRDALLNLLKSDPRDDFGKHLIPTQVQKGNAAAYLFNGYWEDIGTIGSFYQANIAMTGNCPPLNCYDETNIIYTQPHHLPPPRIACANVSEAIICEGAVIEADVIHRSIIGPRAVLKGGSIIRNSYIMGNDFYSPPIAGRLPSKLQIGENCIIDRAIIDKNVHIGNNVHLVNKEKLSHYNSDHVYIRDGIIVVARGACIPDNFVL